MSGVDQISSEAAQGAQAAGNTGYKGTYKGI
jgi:hypothetical protein